jgi:hypothetical protein
MSLNGTIIVTCAYPEAGITVATSDDGFDYDFSAKIAYADSNFTIGAGTDNNLVLISAN